MINQPFPNKKYQIIYADPPWQYEHCISNSRKIENQYPTMILDDIKSLKIPKDKDSILFLWATAPKLTEAIEVMTAWGYSYRTNLVWDKEVLGMGYWLRNQHELLLIGVCGNVHPPSPELRISSVLRVKRAGHSDKPDHVKFLISKWYPDFLKIELFAREKTPLLKENNWDKWGNEE